MATCLKEQASSWSASSCRPEAGSSSADLARESRFLSNTPALNQEESSYKQFRYIHNHKLHTKESAFNYILPRRCQPRRENTIMQRYMLHVIIVTCYMLSLLHVTCYQWVSGEREGIQCCVYGYTQNVH